MKTWDIQGLFKSQRCFRATFIILLLIEAWDTCFMEPRTRLFYLAEMIAKVWRFLMSLSLGQDKSHSILPYYFYGVSLWHDLLKLDGVETLRHVTAVQKILYQPKIWWILPTLPWLIWQGVGRTIQRIILVCICEMMNFLIQGMDIWIDILSLERMKKRLSSHVKVKAKSLYLPQLIEV